MMMTDSLGVVRMSVRRSGSFRGAGRAGSARSGAEKEAGLPGDLEVLSRGDDKGAHRGVVG